MRRLARRLLTLCSALSLVLCAAVCVLWVRSYSRADIFGYEFGGPDPLGWRHSHRAIKTSNGYLRVWKFDEVNRFNVPTHPFTPVSERTRWFLKTQPLEWRTYELRPRTWHFGIGWWDQHTRFPERQIDAWVLAVPCWYLVVALSAIPAYWMAARLLQVRRRLRRAKSGSCIGCGYDLRASPDRCPECGAVREPPHNPPMQRTATARTGGVE